MNESVIKGITDLGDISGHTIVVTVSSQISTEQIAMIRDQLDGKLSDAKSVLMLSENVKIESRRVGDAAFAAMAYMIVHDFQLDVIVSARAELRRDGESGYRDNVSAIESWATKAGFSTIARHAKNALEWIDESEDAFSVDNI